MEYFDLQKQQEIISLNPKGKKDTLESKKFNTPILFLVYNRPDVTKKILHIITQIRPSKLYIAADGPKNELDKIKCLLVKKIITDLASKFNIRTLFQEKNLGCGKAVSTAINWFFQNEEKGIILEDDTLPNLSFFYFCEELLIRYENNLEIMHISGLNWQDGNIRGENSYYFSAYPGIWGWATWRNRWMKYDYNLSELKNFITSKKIKEITSNQKEQDYHIKTFNSSNKIDTWDHQWKFTIFNSSGLCITPNKNLVSNIGFGKNATHTRKYVNFLAHRKTLEMKFPLKHPTSIEINLLADRYLSKKNFNTSIFHNIIRKISYLILRFNEK